MADLMLAWETQQQIKHAWLTPRVIHSEGTEEQLVKTGGEEVKTQKLQLSRIHSFQTSQIKTRQIEQRKKIS